MWCRFLAELQSPDQLWFRSVSKVRRTFRQIRAFRGKSILTSEILDGLDPSCLPDPSNYVFEGCVEVRNSLVIGNGIASREGGRGIDLERSLWFGEISETPVFRKKNTLIFEGPDERAYYLAGCGSANYFHWLLETLPRIHHVNTESGKGLYVVPPLQKFHQETLSFLELDRSNSRFIEVHDSEVWRFPLLKIPSPLNYCGMPSELLLSFWNSAVERNHADVPRKPEKRIYLSRTDASTRRVSNESELIEALQKLGFELIQCSRLSFAQQVRLFREASVITGPHGAAMANLIFSREGTRVLELGTRAYENPCFEHLCASSGILYSKFIGKEERSGDPGSDYTVDVDSVMTALKGML